MKLCIAFILIEATSLHCASLKSSLKFRLKFTVLCNASILLIQLNEQKSCNTILLLIAIVILKIYSYQFNIHQVISNANESCKCQVYYILPMICATTDDTSTFINQKNNNDDTRMIKLQYRENNLNVDSSVLAVCILLSYQCIAFKFSLLVLSSWE